MRLHITHQDADGCFTVYDGTGHPFIVNCSLSDVLDLISALNEDEAARSFDGTRLGMWNRNGVHRDTNQSDEGVRYETIANTHSSSSRFDGQPGHPLKLFSGVCGL